VHQLLIGYLKKQEKKIKIIMNKDRFKFRGWDKPSYDFPEGCMTYFDIHKGIGDCDVIMQCLGIKDKNGKFIYEGDLLKRYKKSGECYMKIKQVYFYSKLFDLENHEIIGNIYENPELLTNDK